MRNGFWARTGIGGVVAAVAIACAAPVASGRPVHPVKLGTAIWWACAEERFQGPAVLRCPAAYTPRYEAAVRDTFDVVVPENELKMPWIRPNAVAYDFSYADRIVRWARVHGKTVRGHTLIWGHEMAPWVDRLPIGLVGPVKALVRILEEQRQVAQITATLPRDLLWTRRMLLNVMRDYITTVMRHYRDAFPGVVTQWDVVNEAFAADGSLEKNLFLRVIGPDYIQKAFQYARAADPDAKLFYNEYGAQELNPRSRAVLALARDFRRRGVPLDGIGIQMHVSTANYPRPRQLRRLLRAYGRLGLQVEITEMDVTAPPTPDGLAGQRVAYQSVFVECRLAPNCTGVTVWGVADPYSWRGGATNALLFGRDLEPKPFLGRLKRLLVSPAAACRQVRRHPACVSRSVPRPRPG